MHVDQCARCLRQMGGGIRRGAAKHPGSHVSSIHQQEQAIGQSLRPAGTGFLGKLKEPPSDDLLVTEATRCPDSSTSGYSVATLRNGQPKHAGVVA